MRDGPLVWTVETINKLAGPDGVKTTEGFVGGMFTKTYSRPEVEWVVKQNLKMPREYAAALLYNHSTHFMFMESPDKFNRIVRDFMG